MDTKQLARKLFNAFERGDGEAVRGLCHRDLEARQNNGPRMSVEELLGFSQAVLQVVTDFRYDDITCTATERGFVEEHSVRGTLPDGSALELVACVVVEVDAGKIVALREYVDTVAAAGLLAALESARRGRTQP